MSSSVSIVWQFRPVPGGPVLAYSEAATLSNLRRDTPHSQSNDWRRFRTLRRHGTLFGYSSWWDLQTKNKVEAKSVRCKKESFKIGQKPSAQNDFLLDSPDTPPSPCTRLLWLWLVEWDPWWCLQTGRILPCSCQRALNHHCCRHFLHQTTKTFDADLRSWSTCAENCFVISHPD